MRLAPMSRGRKRLYDLDKIGAWYVDFVLSNHYAPTVREVCKQFGIRSTSTGMEVVRALVATHRIKGMRQKDMGR